MRPIRRSAYLAKSGRTSAAMLLGGPTPQTAADAAPQQPMMRALLSRSARLTVATMRGLSLQGMSVSALFTEAHDHPNTDTSGLLGISSWLEQSTYQLGGLPGGISISAFLSQRYRNETGGGRTLGATRH